VNYESGSETAIRAYRMSLDCADMALGVMGAILVILVGLSRGVRARAVPPENSTGGAAAGAGDVEPEMVALKSWTSALCKWSCQGGSRRQGFLTQSRDAF